MSEPTKAELQKALDVIEDAVGAETEKDAQKAAKAADALKNEALSEKVGAIVDKVVDVPQKSDKVDEDKASDEKSDAKSEKSLTDEEKKARFEYRLSRIAGGSPR